MRLILKICILSELKGEKFPVFLREAAKKGSFSFVDSPQCGGEGVSCCPLRKKDFFFFKFVAVLLTTKPRGRVGQRTLWTVH